MLKPLPRLRTDAEAEAFVDNADLTDYDLSSFKRHHFEFEAKTAQLNMRLPKTLLDAVKDKAARQGLPYTRMIRMILETSLGDQPLPAPVEPTRK